MLSMSSRYSIWAGPAKSCSRHLTWDGQSSAICVDDEILLKLLHMQARERLTRPLPRPSQPQFSSSESGSSDSEEDARRARYRGASQPSPETSDLLISTPGAVEHDSVPILNTSAPQYPSHNAAESLYRATSQPALATFDTPADARPASSQQQPRSAPKAQRPFPLTGQQSLSKTPPGVVDVDLTAAVPGGNDLSLEAFAAAAGRPHQQSGVAISPEASQAVSRSMASVHPSESNSTGPSHQGSAQRHRWTEQEARATRDVLKIYGKDWQRLQVRIIHCSAAECVMSSTFCDCTDLNR